MTLATIERTNPIVPIEKKLPRVRATIIENIKPTKPSPAPSAINNLPVITLFLLSYKQPAITDMPPKDAMIIRLANTI